MSWHGLVRRYVAVLAGAILFDDATGDACAAAAQGCRLVRVIVAADVDHD